VARPQTQDRGETTRRRIVETATELFREHGFDATPVSAIIEAAEVTKGGFYFHFPSKVALGLDVMDAMRTEQRDTVIAAVSAHPRAVDQLVAMAHIVADSDELNTGAAIGRMCIEIKADPAAPSFDTAFDEWFTLVTDLLRRAQAEGDADPHVDPETTGFMIVAAFLGLDYVEQIRESPGGVTARVDDFVRFVFRGAGIRHPDAPGDPSSPSPDQTTTPRP